MTGFYTDHARVADNIALAGPNPTAIRPAHLRDEDIPMLITFKTDAHADIVMFGDVALTLLKLIVAERQNSPGPCWPRIFPRPWRDCKRRSRNIRTWHWTRRPPLARGTTIRDAMSAWPIAPCP